MKYLLSGLINNCPFPYRTTGGIFSPKKDDASQLVATLQATGLGGIVSLLYGILLHGGAPPRDSTMTPPQIPEHTLNVVGAGIRMLSSIATLDLNVLQVRRVMYKVSQKKIE